MSVICDCQYTTLALKSLIPPEQREFVHVIIYSWRQVSGIVFSLSQTSSSSVYLYLPPHLMKHKDVFFLIIPGLMECRILSHFFMPELTDDYLYTVTPSENIILSGADLGYLRYVSMGCNTGGISALAGKGLRKVYNRRALLIRKLNLPNDNVLVILSSSLLSVNRNKHSRTGNVISIMNAEPTL